MTCHNCPPSEAEELSAVLFTGYGLLLLLPYVSVVPFYQPVSLELHRWWLGVVLLACGGLLLASVRWRRCNRRAQLSLLSFCLWWMIASVYIQAQMPPLPIFGAFVCGLFMSRSWSRLKIHLRQQQHHGGGSPSRHAMA
jgi:Kef-type K+ transport system membrane component KefB